MKIVPLFDNDSGGCSSIPHPKRKDNYSPFDSVFNSHISGSATILILSKNKITWPNSLVLPEYQSVVTPIVKNRYTYIRNIQR